MCNKTFVNDCGIALFPTGISPLSGLKGASSPDTAMCRYQCAAGRGEKNLSLRLSSRQSWVPPTRGRWGPPINGCTARPTIADDAVHCAAGDDRVVAMAFEPINIFSR